MKRTTFDRGAILHFAGFHRLSPALDAGGGPALAAELPDGARRCGWEPFFAAMAARRLALTFDPDDGASARFVRSGEAKDGGEHPTLASAIAHARRFVKALRGGPAS
jgi:hypothetical protein